MLEDLEAATSYSIVIEALSGGGEGPASIEITGTTKKMGKDEITDRIHHWMGGKMSSA